MLPSETDATNNLIIFTDIIIIIVITFSFCHRTEPNKMLSVVKILLFIDFSCAF